MYDSDDPVAEAIRLYKLGKIGEAEGKIMQAYMEWIAGGPTLTLNQDDLKNFEISADEYKNLLKQSGVPIV